MKNKIALIIPYFGELPVYLPLFINSLAGKSFDFLFFSDCFVPDALPDNVKWNMFTFQETKVLFEKILKVNVVLENSYKLCDLKPTLGLVFQEFILEYDFWGSIDTDLVVGNIDHFITDEILNNIDFYSGIKEYVSGSFFLVRNNSYCNNLFKKSKDWIKVFENSVYLGFDECGGHYFAQLKAGESIFELNTLIQSFTEIIFSEVHKGLRILLTNDILEPKGPAYVTIGTDGITYFSKEYLLVHFIYFKANYYFKIYPYINNAPYYIGNLGNFKNKPTILRVIFSKNLVAGVLKKIQINLKKIKI